MAGPSERAWSYFTAKRISREAVSGPRGEEEGRAPEHGREAEQVEIGVGEEAGEREECIAERGAVALARDSAIHSVCYVQQ